MRVALTRRALLAAAVVGAMLPGVQAWAGEPLKVAFVYPSPIGDYGWTYSHEVARQAVEAKFGDKVSTTFVENVPEGPDAERVIRQLAASGQDLIFAASFGYMNPVLRVAKQFPGVKFEHATGYQRAPNVSTYNARFHEGRVIFGTIAAHMTKSGIIGYIGSFPIPEVIMGINAFTLAAQKIRPDIQVRVVWTNSWYDPGKEAEAAKALIDQGADFLTQHTNSPAPLQVAEERGAYAFGQDTDMSAFAPRAHLTAIVNNWAPYYIDRVQAALDGTWTSQGVWHGLQEGMVELAPYGEAVPPDVVAAAEAARKALMSGERHPFAGPIKNRKGEEVVPAGEVLSDEEIHKMNWFVPGVEGSL